MTTRELPDAETVQLLAHPEAANAILHGLRTITEDVQPTPSSSRSVVDVLTAVLRGNRRTRTDPRPDPLVLRDQVARQYVEDAPLRLLTMWGAVKHYVEPSEQGVDLAELWAGVRMAAICDAIGSVHGPGGETSVLVEDLGVWYQDGFGEPPEIADCVERSIASYVSSLRSLLAIIDPRLRPVTFLDVFGGCVDDYIEALERNTSLIERHLDGLQSGARAPDRDLLDAGWRGDLSSQTLDHYLGRVRSLHPGEPHRKQLERVSRFLGTVLLYEQYGWQQAASPNAIRLAFYKPPPAMPVHRLHGRVHVRGLPRSCCSTMMPPWTSCGCVVTEPDGRTRSHLESFRELAQTTANRSDVVAALTRDQLEMSFRVRWISRSTRVRSTGAPQ
ncbi:MAG: hypothetical protein QOK43_2182 [Acidimicrobiaceae bacterium]|nr:hypothetical protein [Acidimicrobiaceae bacterium]